MYQSTWCIWICICYWLIDFLSIFTTHAQMHSLIIIINLVVTFLEVRSRDPPCVIFLIRDLMISYLTLGGVLWPPLVSMQALFKNFICSLTGVIFERFGRKLHDIGLQYGYCAFTMLWWCTQNNTLCMTVLLHYTSTPCVYIQELGGGL